MVAVFRGFPWRKVVPYCVAQVAGAFTGAALVFLEYRLAFLKFDSSLERTAGVFATFPNAPWAGFFDQVLGSFLLLLLVFIAVDDFVSEESSRLNKAQQRGNGRVNTGRSHCSVMQRPPQFSLEMIVHDV